MQRGMKGSPRKKIWLILPLVLLMLALFTAIVMLLWNNVLTAVLHVQAISYWQAMGLLVLCKILFGGPRWAGGGPQRWRNRMFEKWQQMSPEEREKFRARWEQYCRREKRSEGVKGENIVE